MKLDLPGGKSLSLVIAPIDGMFPHEDTIPDLLRAVTSDLLRTRLQRDPILLDARSGVVLDGMHRRAALKSIGAKYALCAEYDYSSDEVKLQRWLRYFIAPERAMVNQIVELFGLERRPTIDRAIGDVDSGKSALALLSRSGSFVMGKQRDLAEVYARISRFDEICRAAAVEIQFIQETGKLDAFSSESVYVLYPAPLSKRDVLTVARAGRVFPFKTTRHIVPVRPMGVYFPTEFLKGHSQSENESELKSIISQSQYDIVERDLWYEGRVYAEPLVVFRRPGVEGGT